MPETVVVLLITQRSQVQILPPLQRSAGQRPDHRMVVGPLGVYGSVVAAGSGPDLVSSAREKRQHRVVLGRLDRRGRWPSP
jgi:hypothetical protein